MKANFRRYPNTPTAAEHMRQTLWRIGRAAAAVAITATATAFFTILFITF